MSGRPRALTPPHPGTALFHHKLSVCPITDSQPAVRDNSDLIGAARRVPVSEATLEAAKIPFWDAL